MSGLRRQGLRIVIDCADPRPLSELQRGPRPRGVRVRCRRALSASGTTVQTVLQAEVVAPDSCTPEELGNWLSACFARSRAPWYIDGVPAVTCTSSSRSAPAREMLLRLAL